MNITRYKNIFLFAYIGIIIVGLALLFFFKPSFGIDFTGGALIEIRPKQPIELGQLRETIEGSYPDRGVIVQSSAQNQFIIRAKVPGGEFDQFKNKVVEAIPDAEILRHENIGATVGKTLTQKSIYGVILACILIIFYLAYAFRGIPGIIPSWAFGVIAVLALIHDLIFTIASYAVIGHFTGFELEGITVVAILTILGFSVHDTIVVFDRIRENLIKYPHLDIAQNTNNSINETLARSLNTSLTVIVVLISMYMLGGTTIKPFVLILTIGMAIGTYSSIFIASPLLVKYGEYIGKHSK